MTKLCFIIFTLSVVIIYGCKTHVDNPITESRPPQHGSSQFAGLDVYFVDTLAQDRAEEIITSLDLTIIDFSNYNLSSPHRGLVGVPSGEEQKWIDSLSTYIVVVAVSPVVVVTN